MVTDTEKSQRDVLASEFSQRPLDRNVLDECKGLERVTERVQAIERNAFKAGWDAALSDRNIQYLLRPLSIWARKAFYERLASLRKGQSDD